MLTKIRVCEAADTFTVTMKPGGVARARVSPPVFWAARVLLAAGCQAAASFEALQCEGPVSTAGSGCHPEDDLQGSGVGFQAKGYMFSQPFHLIVSYDWLILQSPATPLFEGDPLVLRCQAWQDWPLTEVTFYRGGSALGPPQPNKEFLIAVAREEDSGNYHCSAIFQGPGPGSPETASSVAVTVHELFPAPVLRAFPSAEPQEGGAMTLSCRTKLPLQRSAARLLFSFYKDGRAVRGRGPSPELQVPAASEAHSGSYWCEAATEDGQVWKNSPKLEVRVKGPSRAGAPPTLNPSPRKSAAPGTPDPEPPRPPPPPPSSSSESADHPSPLQAPDPHLYHQMSLLLKQMQDVQVLLGHLVMELRDLSGYLKLESRKGHAKRA
ncbi:Fc receptor-like A isoform 2-T2 [Molossus nigricans]